MAHLGSLEYTHTHTSFIRYSNQRIIVVFQGRSLDRISFDSSSFDTLNSDDHHAYSKFDEACSK